MLHFPLVSLKIKMLKIKGIEKQKSCYFSVHRLGYGFRSVLFKAGKIHVSLASSSYSRKKAGCVLLKLRSFTYCLTKKNGIFAISGGNLT